MGILEDVVVVVAAEARDDGSCNAKVVAMADDTVVQNMVRRDIDDE
jgi:hypothetical protein